LKHLAEVFCPHEIGLPIKPPGETLAMGEAGHELFNRIRDRAGQLLPVTCPVDTR
jgi:hypothetical protein